MGFSLRRADNVIGNNGIGQRKMEWGIEDERVEEMTSGQSG